MQITRLKPANIEAIIEHLIFRIRASNRAHNTARSFGWLFVHGFEEGASFEFGAGAAVSDPQLLLEYETGGEIWDYADAYENEADDEVPGERELEGVYEWSEADWQRAKQQVKSLCNLAIGRLFPMAKSGKPSASPRKTKRTTCSANTFTATSSPKPPVAIQAKSKASCWKCTTARCPENGWMRRRRQPENCIEWLKT